MIKRFIIAIILLVLICGGIVGFNMFRDKAIQQYFANMPVVPLTVSTVKVEPVTWTPGIEAIGTVSASQGVSLTVETTGVVKEILFKANDRVEQGQLLVRLDDAVEQADLAAAKTQAALDAMALERAQALRKSGAGTQVTLDAASAAASSSKSQVTKTQALADQKLLRAPFSGIVGIPKIDLGQYLAPGNPVVSLQNVDTMRVDFTVPEQQFPNLKMGQPVAFGLTADDMPYKGSITGIDPRIDPSSRLVSVRSEVVNPDARLTPGQFLQVRVEQPKEDGVIAVPQTALTTSLYGDYVYVVRPAEKKPAAPAAGKDGQAAAAEQPKDKGPELAAYQVFVKTGRRSDGRIEITDGVKPGEQIVTAGQNRLSNGAPVKVDNAIDPSKLVGKESGSK
ncbi:efflux RND transporter periplasmic adaptor subunit [Mesorhizobium sp. SP-1A]|uniref:efflux RND transporter periplasmic adaptor subunit n=1 Tax=Mesorhizobium sp. SP-1A TaxID=3077840 RepID=UPI0028F71EB9|nr:efflux RND transporter periplasmic adaptor subunit [Mesorhizobium sp. SP-1A]